MNRVRGRAGRYGAASRTTFVTRCAALEPPGLLGLNYGPQTPAVAVAAHLAYGIALGLLLTVH